MFKKLQRCLAVAIVMLMAALSAFATDPTSLPSGASLTTAFNGTAWTYTLVGLGVMASLFGLGLFIRLIKGRRVG